MDELLKIVNLYKLPIILGGISILAITISIILLIKSVQTSTPIEFSQDHIASGSSVLGESTIKVDVEGAVARPGLYNVPDGSRVEDAIAVAGGLAPDADDEYIARTINRAMKLVDGAKLYIPARGAESSSFSSSSVSSVSDLSHLVSVNSASESQLDTLPGVGPVTAKKIIDNRPYQTLEELVSKKAVGTALFEKIKSQISL